MSGGSIAKELGNIRKRYRDATLSLKIFVRDSLKGVDEKTSQILYVRDLFCNGEKFPLSLRETIENMVVDNLKIVEPHTRMLSEMSLVYAGALFDGLVSDVLMIALQHVPEVLRGGRNLTTEEVLAFPSRDDLIEELARRDVFEITRENIEKQFNYFRKAFNVDVFGRQSLDITIADLAAVRERRNLIVHNNGLANASYVSKYCPHSSVGDPVIVNAESAKSDCEILRNVGMALGWSFYERLVPLKKNQL